MKKIILSLVLCASAAIIFAQPSVTLTSVNVTETSFEISFEPNEQCAYYKVLAMTYAEIEQWTQMMQVPVEELISQWGERLTTSDTFEWTDMVPATTYKVMALPYGTDSVAAPYNYIDVTTLSLGGSDTSVIAIEVSQITESSAYVVCTPNDQTSLFYDGLVTDSLLDAIGIDSVCTILRENLLTPFYSTDAWLWQGLIPATDYHAIAFGQNGDSIWGDTTIVSFATLAPSGIAAVSTSPIVVYPMPNNGTFTLVSDDLQGGTALIFSTTGQLLRSLSLNNRSNHIETNLPSGSYVLKVTNHRGVELGSRVIVIQ